MASVQITPDCQVVLHYALSLTDGTEVVSTFEESPLTFTFGDGTMEEALENTLVGLACGDEAQFILSGDEVFGPRSAEKIQRIDQDQFPDAMEIALGKVIAFTTPLGEEVAGQIEDILPDGVLIDFNHPLSGKTIGFRVKILEIDPQIQN